MYTLESRLEQKDKEIAEVKKEKEILESKLISAIKTNETLEECVVEMAEKVYE